MSFDPETVRAFEHAGWQRAAGEYDATFARASGLFVEALLDAARVAAGDRVLDLCCGTGLVTAAAARRRAVASGLDFSEAMLGEARRKNPRLRFDQGDAEALPYADDAFDAAVANFGIHHVPNPAKAAVEAVRVLRPGGRVAITTWAPPADNIAWKLLFDAVAAYGDPAAARTPPSGGTIGSTDAMRQLLHEAGCRDLDVALVRRDWVVAEPRELLGALARGTVRTAALIAAQPPSALPVIEAAIAEAAAAYRRADGYAVPVAAILASGVKAECVAGG